MKYTFFARDYFSNSGSFDFSREHYCALINNCFRTCSYYSLLIHEDCELINQLDEWQMPEHDFPFQNESHPYARKYYCLNDYAKRFFLTNANSIFDFVHSAGHKYPEDPVFYREDRTVYLDTVAHEGECSIFPDTEEEILDLLSFGNWIKMEGGTVWDEGEPAVPARIHQLPMLESWNLLQDSLYLTLQELHQMPEKFRVSPDIYSLLAFIDSHCDAQGEKMGLPLGAPRSVPKWFIAFRLYVLGECDANTNESIPDALNKAGLGGAKAYQTFFFLLSRFSRMYTDAFMC